MLFTKTASPGNHPSFIAHAISPKKTSDWKTKKNFAHEFTFGLFILFPPPDPMAEVGSAAGVVLLKKMAYPRTNRGRIRSHSDSLTT